MSQKKFTLYWSSLAKYENCPQQFLWSKGWGEIDVGGGPGKKKPLPVKISKHHQMMGTAIQGVIEQFYNRKLWLEYRNKPEHLKQYLLTEMSNQIQLGLSSFYVDTRLAPLDEITETIKNGIFGYFNTMRMNHFLGEYSEAEVDMVCYVDKHTPIGGRADLIIRRQDTGITILDGKNSKRYKGGKTYTDPDQLRWYALTFKLSYNKLPDRLGFFYYRYPYGTPILDKDGVDTGEIEQGVEWVSYTEDDLKGLGDRAVKASWGIKDEKFDPNPVPSYCKFCDYETVCPQRLQQKANNSKERKPKIIIPDGFSELSF
jgi:hypothetical protein